MPAGDLTVPITAHANRSIIYIDGFNLYYGAIRGSRHKWLNLQNYFMKLRGGDAIQRIKYFTALVDGGGRTRQETYLRALATCPLVEVVIGRYKYKRVKCSVSACQDGCDKWFQVPEEKRTDVNIAVTMLEDAFQDKCDRFILVSGDSDLVPAVNRIKANFPAKQVVVYVPSQHPERGAAYELRGSADKHRTLPLELLKRSQFPAEVPCGDGTLIHKPREW
jgi:uncharacterized LabA/DUF88 family protein